MQAPGYTADQRISKYRVRSGRSSLGRDVDSAYRLVAPIRLALSGLAATKRHTTSIRRPKSLKRSARLCRLHSSAGVKVSSIASGR